MRPARLLTASVAAALTLAALTACDGYTNHPSDGGRTSAEVSAAFEALPGVLNADAYTAPWYNPGEGGLFSSRGVDFLLWVTIDREMHIVDTTEFLRQLGREARSFNDGYSPDGDVTLIVRRGLHVNHDWQTDAVAVFGEDVRLSRDPDIAFIYFDDKPPVGDDDVVLSIPGSAYEKAFGGWPDEGTELESGLLAEGAPQPEDPFAVADFYTSGVLGGGDKCVGVSFRRGTSLDGERYHGDVTVTLFVGSREYGQAVARGSSTDENGGESRVDFCGDDAPANRIGDVRSNVFAPAMPGFREVDRTGVSSDW